MTKEVAINQTWQPEHRSFLAMVSRIEICKRSPIPEVIFIMETK